jgi:lauroyl/myristoyl acyltransferase
VNLFRLSLPETAELVRRIHVPTLQPLDDALAAGKGAIIATAHVGNLETIVQKLALRGDKVLIPVEPIRPPALLDLIRTRRGALGIQIEPIGPDTFRQMTSHLREGGIVIIVSDRDVQGTGQLVPFFGRMVRLPNAAILLALRTGASLLVAFGYRHRDNRISGRVAEPLEFRSGAKGSGSRSLRADLEEGMRVLAAIMEQEIRHDPGQWLVQQPVFRPAAGTPEARHGNASRRPTTNMLSRESSA